jgi:hypothetical protein
VDTLMADPFLQFTPYTEEAARARGIRDTGSGLTAARPPNDLRGEALQQWYDENQPRIGSFIHAIRQGDVSAKGRNLQEIMPLATLIDPTLNQSDYDTRAKTRAAYTPAQAGGKEIRAINSAIGHADQLDGLISQMEKFYTMPDMLPGLNQYTNAVRWQLDPKYQKIRKDAQAKVDALAGEMSKAFNGGTSALADREHYRSGLNLDDPIGGLRAGLRSYMELLRTRLESHADAYNSGMQTTRDQMHFLSPRNAAIYSRLRGVDAPEMGGAAPVGLEDVWGGGAPPAGRPAAGGPQPAPGRAPQPGSAAGGPLGAPGMSAGVVAPPPAAGGQPPPPPSLPATAMTSGVPIPEGATAVNRQTGQIIRMQGGRWVPVQ